MTGSGVRRAAAGNRGAYRGIWWTVRAVVAASAVVALAACGGSPRAASAAGGTGSSSVLAASHAETDHINLIGKIDADMGAMGTFTGKAGWPAMFPADIRVKAGATVVITIKEYDDMVTPVASLSPYLKVMGGTESVNGKPVTSVGNNEIAHTFTIPSLGINVPLPVASMGGPMGSMGGPTTVRFTFRAPAAAGTYLWLCVTPCGTGPYGIAGAMHTDDWMRGHLIVS